MTLAFGVVVGVVFLGWGHGKGSRFGWGTQLKHSVLDTLNSSVSETGKWRCRVVGRYTSLQLKINLR